MPIYEYACRECGHRFEYLVLHSTPPPECPACRKQDLEQLISHCTVSSESTRQASLSAAHNKAALARGEKDRADHEQSHRHFED